LADVLPVEVLVEKWAWAPRRLLGIEVPTLSVGSPAEIALMAPGREWKVEAERLRSRSTNTPLDGHWLRGKPVGIINRTHIVWA
jgi:Dihydroorotase and related cyclic amidohydrolases